MKPIYLALFLIPTLVFSQTWRPTPEKKDNAIRIHGVTFQQAVRKLIGMAYRIDKLDSNYQTVQVNIDQYQTMYIRYDTGQNMIITSDINIPGNMFGDHLPVLYFKAAINRARWDQVMKYAGTFEGIEYGKL